MQTHKFQKFASLVCRKHSVMNDIKSPHFIFVKLQPLPYLLYLSSIWRWPAALCEGHRHFWKQSTSCSVSGTSTNEEHFTLLSRRVVQKSLKKCYVHLHRIFATCSRNVDYIQKYVRLDRAGLTKITQESLELNTNCVI